MKTDLTPAKKFKHKDSQIQNDINLMLTTLRAQSMLAVGWWKFFHSYLKTISPEEKESIKDFMYQEIEKLEDQMEDMLESLETENL